MHRVRADEAAVRLELAEIQRNVGHRRRQEAAGGAAGEIRPEDMTLGHARAELVDQLLRGNAGGRELDAGLLHAAGDGEAAQSLALTPAMGAEPAGALLDDVAHPEQRLDVLLQRRPAE